MNPYDAKKREKKKCKRHILETVAENGWFSCFELLLFDHVYTFFNRC